MNRMIWLLCALCGSLAWGQAKPGTTGPEDDKNSAVSASVPMDAAVLTIKGFCPGKKSAPEAGGATSCVTIITRAQFEKIATAIRPNMTASVKEQLASLYPWLLVMSEKAEELGLDKQSPYEQMIAFSRMQILTQGLTRRLQADSAGISDREIADYYQKNPEAFDEYSLLRLLVPLRKQPVSSGDAGQDKNRNGGEQAESDPELTQLAENLQLRASAGEDFTKLQREAFEAAGVKVDSPTTSTGKVRRSALPATQEALFALRVGEVSQVLTDAGGHYIYKLEAKDRLPLEQVKSEIRHTLEGQRAKEALDRVQASYSTENNKAYFGLQASKNGQ
jgi:PPIC-type PPIASE domain